MTSSEHTDKTWSGVCKCVDTKQAVRPQVRATNTHIKEGIHAEHGELALKQLAERNK